MSLDFSALLTVKDMAKLCGTTRQTVYRWVETGVAPLNMKMPDDRIYFYPAEARIFADARKKPLR
jgi:predicted DNA-binding transcriptional regulator AlpA